MFFNRIKIEEIISYRQGHKKRKERNPKQTIIYFSDDMNKPQHISKKEKISY